MCCRPRGGTRCVRRHNPHFAKYTGLLLCFNSYSLLSFFLFRDIFHVTIRTCYRDHYVEVSSVFESSFYSTNKSRRISTKQYGLNKCCSSYELFWTAGRSVVTMNTAKRSKKKFAPGATVCLNHFSIPRTPQYSFHTCRKLH